MISDFSICSQFTSVYRSNTHLVSLGHKLFIFSADSISIDTKQHTTIHEPELVTAKRLTQRGGVYSLPAGLLSSVVFLQAADNSRCIIAVITAAKWNDCWCDFLSRPHFEDHYCLIRFNHAKKNKHFPLSSMFDKTEAHTQPCCVWSQGVLSHTQIPPDILLPDSTFVLKLQRPPLSLEQVRPWCLDFREVKHADECLLIRDILSFTHLCTFTPSFHLSNPTTVKDFEGLTEL